MSSHLGTLMSKTALPDPVALKPFVDRLERLVSHLGKPEFPMKLLQFLGSLVPIDHLSIFIFDHQLVPRLVAAESIGELNLAKKAGREYENSFSYRHDPNTQLIKSHQGGGEGPILMRLKADEISDSEYREKIYRRFKLLDRLSVIDQLNGRWCIINLYRDVESGEFNNQDLAYIQPLLELVSALLKNNFLQLPPSVWQATTRPTNTMLEKIIVRLDASLSQREIQVCSRALLGMTSTGIGLDLGIQPATVATLRKRAYAKLNISGLNELFALCLSKTITDPDSH